MAQGQLLRAARIRRQMTLHDVEAVTQGEFKAASLSAYERGERAISVLRLLRIVDVYKTTLGELLPPLSAADDASAGRMMLALGGEIAPEERAVIGSQRVRIDIERLDQVEGPGWDQLRNVVCAIQRRRRGRSSRFLVLRGEDVWIVAAIFGTTPRDVVPILVREGLARPG
ncbi:MAG: transcriptional regulator [Acidimicrobiaceae bacterium]|nr:transcriptional regulator [Acidimicrobiaceae bacterium]